MKILITILITLTSFICSAKESEIDSAKIHECRMEITALDSAIKELQIQRDSIKAELRKAGGSTESNEDTKTMVMGVCIIAFAAVCCVGMIINK